MAVVAGIPGWPLACQWRGAAVGLCRAMPVAEIHQIYHEPDQEMFDRLKVCSRQSPRVQMGELMLDGSGPKVVRVSDPSILPEDLRSNGISMDRPVLECVGGAAGLEDTDLSAIAELLRDHLIPAIDRWGVTVVDGGTDSGVMRLIGQAHSSMTCSFQLIGVAAAGTVRQPDSQQPPHDAADIEPNHTHIILVPGSSWGDETTWLSAATQAISAAKPSPPS